MTPLSRLRDEHDESPALATDAAPVAPIRLRAVVIAVVLTFLCGIWVRQAEIVVLSTQITESVPAIPALAVLFLLVLLNPVLRRLGERFALNRAEILVIYCFVVIAISMLGVGVVRFWLALITHVFYFATPSNEFASLYAAFPDWLVVKDPRAIHELYLRSPGGAVPWGVWLRPLAAWTLFFFALWLCMLCMMLLVRRRWIDGERLTFPIVELPLEITSTVGQRGQPAFLRDPMMWTGFALAAVYNIWNMLQGLWPSVPAPGKLLDLTPLLQNTTWRWLQPLELWYRPELVGLGILVPSEILFSVWFFYALSKLESLLALRQAADIPGMPFEQEQSIGVFLMLGLWLLWQARADVRDSLLLLLRRRRTNDERPTTNEPLGNPQSAIRNPQSDDPPRWTVPVLVASLAFLILFCARAGMMPWAAASYIVIVLLTALVCARIRAEAGVPLIWLFPFYQQKKILLYTLGTAAFMRGGLPTIVVFAMLTFLARGYFPSLIGYQIEGLKIASDARISRRTMCAVILAAVVVGLWVAFYFHLTPYYQYGAQNLRDGIWGTDMARQEYTDVIAAQSAHQNPDYYRTGASIVGALLTGAMLLLRRTFVGFPLHPVGYGVATAYGTLVWWPFLTTWVIKTTVLRYGGMRVYRRIVPLFLGFALGHFFVAGAVWGLLGAIWQEGARAYPVWFG